MFSPKGDGAHAWIGRPLFFTWALKGEKQTACILASRRSLTERHSALARDHSSDIRHRQRRERVAVIGKRASKFFEQR